LHPQGFAPKYFAETVGPVEPAFIEALGPLSNRILTNTSWWRNFKTPANTAFIAAYTTKFGGLPTITRPSAIPASRRSERR
jgi:hypothetical protein